MNRALHTLLLLLVMLTGAFSRSNAQLGTSESSREIESYYLLFGVGYALNFYPADTRRALDKLDDVSGVTRVPFSLDFGAYWPVGSGNHLVIGPTATIASDKFSGGDRQFTYLVGMIAASAQYYRTGTIGDGLFARADIGLASAQVSNESFYSDSGYGLGLQVGVGYAIPISSGTSLSIDAKASYRNLPGYETGKAEPGDLFEKGSYTTFTLGVNLLW